MEGPEARQVASVAAALEARRTQITEEIALEAGLLRAELGEVEEKLCAEHVEAVRAKREATRLKGEMGRRDELDREIRAMVEKLTKRVTELGGENRRLRG